MRVFLNQNDVAASIGNQRRRGRPRRAAANDQYIAGLRMKTPNAVCIAIGLHSLLNQSALFLMLPDLVQVSRYYVFGDPARKSSFIPRLSTPRQMSPFDKQPQGLRIVAIRCLIVSRFRAATP